MLSIITPPQHKYPLETLAEVSRFNKRLKSTITIDRLDVAKHSGRWSCTYVYGLPLVGGTNAGRGGGLCVVQDSIRYTLGIPYT